jgi:phospholipid/cholesterol/gamma-HCH transport system substrate-binding protein
MAVKARTEMLAGLFLIVSIILLGLSIWILGSERQIFRRQTPFRVSFKDVKGLSEGAPVRLGGISIGRVSKIGFSNTLSDPRVHVTILINEDYLERVRQDSEVSIETQGLLGDKFLSISAGSQIGEVPPNAELKGVDAADIAGIIGRAQTVVENTVEVSENFKKLVGELRTESLHEVTSAFKGASDLLKQIKEGDGLINQLIYSKKDGQAILNNIKDTSKSIKEITEGIKNGSGVLHTLVYGENGSQTVTALQEAFTKIGEASKKLGDTLEQAKAGSGVLHTLLYSTNSAQDYEQLIKKLHDTADNLKNATDALAKGSGTLGALLIDAKVYDNIVEVTDEAKRSYLLRSLIRKSLSPQQEGQAEASRE